MIDLVSADSALKEHYTNDRVENMVYMDQAFLAMIAKNENFGGKSLPIPLIYGNPQGRSATFTQAQKRGNATHTRYEDFNIKRVKDYSIATIDNEAMEASRGDSNAFVDLCTTEIDGAIRSLKDSIGQKIWGNGSGAIGKVGSISGTTLTLDNPDQVVAFEVGQEIVGAATELSGAIRAVGSSGNGLIISKIDRVNGVLQFPANVTDATNGIPLLAAGDFLFIRGDRNEAGGPSLVMQGIPAWIPRTAPSSTLFWGVDRTVDETRLGGLRFDASNKPIEEGVIDALHFAARHECVPDHLFLSHTDHGALQKAMGTRIQIIDVKVTATIGFRGFEFQGPKGVMKVFADKNISQGDSWAVKLNTWKLHSLGKAWRPLDTDGLKMLRQSSADGVEVRYGGYMQVGCNAPGYNMYIGL